jgi:hypothetical protein
MMAIRSGRYGCAASTTVSALPDILGSIWNVSAVSKHFDTPFMTPFPLRCLSADVHEPFS